MVGRSAEGSHDELGRPRRLVRDPLAALAPRNIPGLPSSARRERGGPSQDRDQLSRRSTTDPRRKPAGQPGRAGDSARASRTMQQQQQLRSRESSKRGRRTLRPARSDFVICLFSPGMFARGGSRKRESRSAGGRGGGRGCAGRRRARVGWSRAGDASLTPAYASDGDGLEKGGIAEGRQRGSGRLQ